MTTKAGASDLFAAVKKGDRGEVERIVDADPGLLDSREGGATPLLTAYYHRQDEVADLLRRKRAPADIFEAAAAGDADLVREFVRRDRRSLDGHSEDGFHPLGLAAFFKRPDAARALLDAGADPNVASRNPMKVTALHSAVADGGHAEIARMLLAAGADPNVRQRHGWTPLHGAAHMGDVKLIRLLLEKGADLDAANDDGKTALAIADERGHHDVVRLLRERGAQP